MFDYQFNPESLNPAKRRHGISAFLRVRNGEDFLHAAIESHIVYFDEIIAVYNQCTDRTPEILYSLQEKHPEKIKVYEYRPRVYPPGSERHRTTPPASVNSLANYSNYALSKTTCKFATKLDDDHLAIDANLSKVIDRIKKNGLDDKMICFSGINLIKSKEGYIGVYKTRPFSGNGDHWFFPVSEETYFVHDGVTEKLHVEMEMEYAGITYFHLKFLKKGYGFTNYELESEPDNYYAPLLKELIDATEVQPFESFVKECSRKANFSPLRGRIVEILTKTPLSLLKLFRQSPVIRRHPFLSSVHYMRTINFRKDIKGVQLPEQELLELINRESMHMHGEPPGESS
ncbi:hypothetical protein BMS3Bbin06_01258 [bacterium BMS3Bbin06]|nr:hypothetical protein BMS3Bbin06_01258 [bacterium BMS3Bbin06]HDH02127.1 hypothetical protein [Nitrospirota bacterium]